MALVWTRCCDVAGNLCIQRQAVRLSEAAPGRFFCSMVTVERLGVGGCIDDVCAGRGLRCCGVKRL